MAWRELGADPDRLDTGAGAVARSIGVRIATDTDYAFDLEVDYSFPESFYTRWGKPLFDRTVGLLALILVSPLVVLIGTAVWVAMDSPVLLAQERVGRRGRVFRLFKFRTMDPDRRLHNLHWIGPDRRKTHKSSDDPRITTLGRWLRATRLDELPQLLNVVLGDLSLVGPRPELVDIVNQYEPWQHRRHVIKPGVTGLWQIADRGDSLLRDCTAMELEYLRDVTLREDLRILLRTVPAMTRKSGF